MRKTLVALALGASLLLTSLQPATVEAQSRSRSSSSRSYSSGSRTSSVPRGKSYSSGSRPSPSKPSAPSSVPRGKSYSSGRSPSPSKPPASSSSGSSSSGSGWSLPKIFRPGGGSQKPRGGSYDSGAGAAQQKAESKEQFGKGSTADRSAPRGPAASPGSVRGKGYVSGNGAPSTTSRRPQARSYDTLAADEKRKEASRSVYTRGQQPRTTYTDSRGAARPIDPKDRQIEELRRDLDHERWMRRESRQRGWFGDYYSRPVVVYQDPFSNVFWWWLLAQSLDTRAHWAYHHRDAMDEARYRDLLARDARLEARIRELEREGVKRDPAQRPEGMDPDLMYTDEYVDAVYNPQPTAPAASRSSRSILGSALRVLLRIFLVIGLMVFVIWLVFFKRWGSSTEPPGR
jgi:hypothetical protein